MTRQRGASGIFIFVLLLLAMLVLIAMLTLSRTSSNVDAQNQTIASLQAASAALEQFAGASRRLPCPANPAVDDGVELPAVPTGNCDFRTGTLPWRTIGMRRDDAYDAWGWKISYRVYSDVNGSMTQAGGASMVDCDTVQALNQLPVDGNGLCQVVGTQRDTPDFAFIAGKGLTVTDFGTAYDGTKPSGGAAYVLISHGFTGLGAYTAAGTQRDAPKSTEEKNNLKATGPFVAIAASDPTVAPDANNHYDDILLYRTVADLAKRANLAARDWQDDPVTSSVAFNQATVSAALGGADPRNNGGDTGQSTIAFSFMTVSGFDASGAQDISFTSGVFGNPDAIGVVGGGSNNLTSTGGEGLRFDLAGDSRQLSASLSTFTGSDRAEVRFYELNRTTNVATLVGTVNRTACGFAGISSFTIDPGATFNRVEIRPIAHLFSGFASSFRVEEIRTCIVGVPCRTTLYPFGDQCP